MQRFPTQSLYFHVNLSRSMTLFFFLFLKMFCPLFFRLFFYRRLQPSVGKSLMFILLSHFHFWFFSCGRHLPVTVGKYFLENLTQAPTHKFTHKFLTANLDVSATVRNSLLYIRNCICSYVFSPVELNFPI